jgi:flagellar basal-body rod modification protein FlgD
MGRLKPSRIEAPDWRRQPFRALRGASPSWHKLPGNRQAASVFAWEREHGMSSLWSNATTAAGISPFGSSGGEPTPGGGAAARFQSILQSAGKQKQVTAQPGLSPAARTSTAAGKANAAASGSSSSSNTSDSTAVISANDFLTLLVTEMQNQDPTADVDPNAYIDQLVQINSLEQLISINENLATVLGAASTPSNSPSLSSNAISGAAPAAGQINGVRASAPGKAGNLSGSSPAATISAARAASQPGTVHGNLAVPGTAPAAKAVGRALGGRGNGRGHAIRDIPTRALP